MVAVYIRESLDGPSPTVPGRNEGNMQSTLFEYETVGELHNKIHDIVESSTLIENAEKNGKMVYSIRVQLA